MNKHIKKKVDYLYLAFGFSKEKEISM